MGKRSRKKKAERNLPHPTMFVHDGVIKQYEDSMLELHGQLPTDQWEDIVTSTVQYKIYVDCLKEIAYPLLHETWGVEEDYSRVMLEHNISRMRNIDPLFVARIDQDAIRKNFEEKIRKNALEVSDDIRRFKEQQQSWLAERSDHTNTDVSGL